MEPIEEETVVVAGKDPTVAYLLELIPGFFQWFGWGHIYAGRVGRGLLVMFGFWILQGINIVLHLVLVGYVTFVVTWFLFLLFSPLSARKACLR